MSEQQPHQPAEAAPPAEEFAEHIPFDEFRNGLPRGRFRVVVNPKLAHPYVKQRLFLIGIAMPMIGAGIALALTGSVWWGGALVGVAVLLSRLVRAQAPKILLHLALRDAKVYQEVTQHGLMEVRRAG